MASVTKSPNMRSTTGRSPVIAAPTPRPVIPASEIGESITRSGPNSSTRPLSTLKGVPASATSSPMMKTLGSRRISSARASLIAWANVSTRGATSCTSSGIDVLRDLPCIGKGRLQRKLNRGRRLFLDFTPDLIDHALIGLPLLEQPGLEQRERVSLPPPDLLLF